MANPIIESLASRVSELELAVAVVTKKQADQAKIQADLDADFTVLVGLLARTEKLVAALKALG
jgi:hypothetical protein